MRRRRLLWQAFMVVYKTLTDEIIADEVADNQVRCLHAARGEAAAGS